MMGIVIIFMLATAAVLFIGLGVMIKGGKFNEKHANKLMMLRVGLQAATIGLLLVMFVMGYNGK